MRRVVNRFVPWKDDLLRRILGFPPFELEEARGPREAKVGEVVRLPVKTA